MARLRFAKYEGLGNDFIIVDGALEIGSEAARALCDRHFGIGADGVLVVSSQGSVPRMRVINADGSRPEMCGNGLRCAAKYLARKANEEEVTLGIETDAGRLVCRVEGAIVQTEAGVLRDLGPVEVTVAGHAHRFARLSIGNPHAVTFEPYDPEMIDRVGPAVERASVFPEGTNVEFARLADGGAIDLVVWERGVGKTLACGTGACATVAAACLRGDRPFGKWIETRLPGGPLQVRVDGDSMRAELRGPARLVFEGEAELP